jgi:hypothetical protein
MKEIKLMKLNTLLSTSVLSFSVLVGASSLTYAQEQREEAKPQQEEARPEAAKPAQDEMKPRQNEAKPQNQEQDKDKARNEEKVKNNEEKVKKDDAKNAKQAEQAGQSNQHAQRAENQHGGRIPDDKFRSNFGRQHTFAVNHPTVVGGQPHFQYGGYSFTIVDAWPAGWAYTDQCYIDYIDGEYFLFDLLHPGVQVALVVVL